MQCYKGITLSSGDCVPCGQCLSCRINRGRKWTARLLLEWAYHPRPSYFVTLTYNEEKVPRTDDDQHLTLRKKDACKWVNNTMLPIYAGPFRYFLVGEYGDRTGRPHLHMAIFPGRDKQITDILKRWTYGHTQASEMSRERAGYLCQYTTKKLTSPNDGRLKEDMEPEFRTSSRVPPIGSTGIDSLIHTYRQPHGSRLIANRGDVERSVRVGGRIYPLDAWSLRKMRKALDIPVTHVGRMDANPNYLTWHEVQEAAWAPEINTVMETRHAKKKQINETRRQSF